MCVVCVALDCINDDVEIQSTVALACMSDDDKKVVVQRVVAHHNVKSSCRSK